MKKLHNNILVLFLLMCYHAFGQTNFSEIDSRVGKIGISSIDNLAESIALGSNSDLEKVRAIFVWLTNNISYDFELYKNEKLKEEFYKSEDILLEKILGREKAICSGYSTLFKKLCNDLNIECEVVNGYSKQWIDGNISKSATDHAWNVTKIDGIWYLIDATWAAKNDYKNERDEFWFMTKPEHFVYSHYPKNVKWTLLKNTITKEEFEQLPIITNRSYFIDEIKVITPSKKVINVEKNRIVKVEIETNNTGRWISIRGYPYETYATKNNLEFPSNEEYAKLSPEEVDKYNLVIPSVEIVKKEIVDNRVILEAKLTSENIEEFEIVVDENTIATIKVNLK